MYCGVNKIVCLIGWLTSEKLLISMRLPLQYLINMSKISVLYTNTKQEITLLSSNIFIINQSLNQEKNKIKTNVKEETLNQKNSFDYKRLDIIFCHMELFFSTFVNAHNYLI